MAVKVTHSPEETSRVAAEWAQNLKPGTVIALYGDLGAGKTTFVQGLARGLGVHEPQEVCSPTFAIIQEYDGKIPLVHVDLYRLEKPEEVQALGLEEYCDGRAIVVIEWPERWAELSRHQPLAVSIRIEEGDKRIIELISPPSFPQLPFLT